MNKQDDIFIDEFANLHQKDTELGRGGQGVVFRTHDRDIAIKLALDTNGSPRPPDNNLHRLRTLRFLPVPERLQLSMPMAMLRDYEGYVMRLLGDMMPFKHFWAGGNGASSAPKVTVPEWLSQLPVPLALELMHYAASGGLKRRLLALYKCSAILCRLHAAGLVYGDVSPANAYVSENADSREVWLIDADNLRFEIESCRSGVFTPGFGAPELVQGLAGGSTRTDCHAFAAMAFWMLTMQHPFLGDLVESDANADWADETNDKGDPADQAYAGLLPWIDDDKDDSNATSKGLPRGLVLTDSLRRLFHQTFGPGRTAPWRRPVIVHWSYALAQALDRCISCAGCGMGFYFESQESSQKCPYCGTGRPALLHATRQAKESGNGTAAEWSWVGPLQTCQSTPVPHRVFYPFSPVNGDNDLLHFTKSEDQISLTPSDSTAVHSLFIAVPSGSKTERFPLKGRTVLPISKNALQIKIHVGSEDGPEIIFSFPEEVL